MTVIVEQAFKNLPVGLEIPDQSLVILTGANNSGKSAILQYLACYGPLSASSDYITPRRFDVRSNVTIDADTPNNMHSAWRQRNRFDEQTSEFRAPEALTELMTLPDDARNKILDWHNQYFGRISIDLCDPQNRWSGPQVTIDGRTPNKQGSGARSVLTVLIALLHPRHDVALIDEPELAIEPAVQRRLFQLLRKVAHGEDDLPQKKVFLATHSPQFLDRHDLYNNFVVTKRGEEAQIRQVTSEQDFHHVLHRLLGYSPVDLLFPENILLVEGPSDVAFWTRVLALSGVNGVAVHSSDSDTRVSEALSAIDQMLKTQVHVRWYRDRLCVAVDANTRRAATDLAAWREFLHDDGTRVRCLTRPGIEYYYPADVVSQITGIEQDRIGTSLDEFQDSIRDGARRADLGELHVSKRELADLVANSLTEAHLGGLSREILDMIATVRDHRLGHGEG